MRIGVIGRSDYSGLATMTQEFCQHFYPHKALIVNRDTRGKTVPEKIRASEVRLWEEGEMSPLKHFLDDCDVIVGFETFYSDEVIPWAASTTKRTVIFVMGECSPTQMVAASVQVAPTAFDKKFFPAAVKLAWPMDPIFHEANYPVKHFVHNAGSLGLQSRNNTYRVIKSYDYNPGYTLHINAVEMPEAWKDECELRGITVGGPKDDRNDLYTNCDCLIHPQAFPGLSLPILEARARSIPVVTMDDLSILSRDYYLMMGRRVQFDRPSVPSLTTVMTRLSKPGASFRKPMPMTWEKFRKQWETYIEPRIRTF